MLISYAATKNGPSRNLSQKKEEPILRETKDFLGDVDVVKVIHEFTIHDGLDGSSAS